MFWNFLAGLYCFRDSRYLHVTASGFGAGVRAVFCSFFFGGGWMEELKNYLWLFGEKKTKFQEENNILPNNHFLNMYMCNR